MFSSYNLPSHTVFRIVLPSNKHINYLNLTFQWASIPTDFPEEGPAMTSSNTIAQVHRTVDLWDKHGGNCVYVGIPGKLFSIFLLFFGTYMS